MTDSPTSVLRRGLRRVLRRPSLALCCALALGAAGIPAAAAPAMVAVGAALPAVRLDPLGGPVRTLASFRGKPLLINVWASWCGPCRAEMASLERLSRSHGKQFTVIGISTDDYRERAGAFLQQSKTGFPNYIDHQLELETMLGADRIPLTVLVDARGRVLARFYGSKTWDSPENVALIARTFGPN